MVAIALVRLTPILRLRKSSARSSQESQVSPVTDARRFWEKRVDATAGSPTEYIWWEAEAPRLTNFPDTNPFAPENAEQAAVLSGGKWIGAANPGKKLFLEYDVQVPDSAEYNLYVRKFWKHGPFKWKFNDDPWQFCERDVKLLDFSELRPKVVANWVNLGRVELRDGTRRLRVELLEENGPSAFDAFVLVRGSFTPRGKLKPNIKYAEAPQGWFAFDPDYDDFSPSELDLRRLNERRAGDDGPIRPRGSTLVHERTGEPVRFWGVNADHDVLFLTRADMQHYARWLAKLGVNLVRLQGSLWQEGNIRAIRTDKLDKLHLFVSILRDEGIYVGLSIYFPIWLELDETQGFNGYTKNLHPFGLPYFSQQLQAIQKGWWRSILTAGNQYTGMPLALDPAVAYVELINEDSTRFWMFDPHKSIPESQTVALQKRFGTWVKNKYGSVGAALSSWGGAAVPGDDVASEQIGIIGFWDMVHRKSARDQDTAEFLARLMRDYYAEMYRYVREELGFRGSVVCSNWKTANDPVLGPLDKWANAICDIMDRHGYYGGPHHGDAASYTVTAGDSYDDATALRFESTEKDTRKKKNSGTLSWTLYLTGSPAL